MKLFTFGRKVAGYSVPVLNEREIRAGAGILFLFAFIAFMNSWLLGNFFYVKMFVIVFLLDFATRLVISPSFSPSMILGRLITQHQTVEYVGAPQKRFAWGMGLVLALTMFWVLVINNNVGPINMIICLTCLTFLFFESVFGICLGCLVYNLSHREKAQLCPGGTCTPHKKKPIQKVTPLHFVVVVAFIVFVFIVRKGLLVWQVRQAALQSEQAEEDCIVPQWAKDIGHEEIYRLHRGCE